MTTVKYQKNNNLCPFCNDKNYIVYGSYKDNKNEIFQCFCEKHNKDFYVKKVINRKEQ